MSRRRMSAEKALIIDVLFPDQPPGSSSPIVVVGAAEDEGIAGQFYEGQPEILTRPQGIGFGEERDVDIRSTAVPRAFSSSRMAVEQSGNTGDVAESPSIAAIAEHPHRMIHPWFRDRFADFQRSHESADRVKQKMGRFLSQSGIAGAGSNRILLDIILCHTRIHKVRLFLVKDTAIMTT